MLVTFHNSFPPASEREARMDDPTRRCENDTGNESHSPGPPIPSGGLFFCPHLRLSGYMFLNVSRSPNLFHPQSIVLSVRSRFQSAKG